jgi:ankyrin repeat protein
LPHPQVIEDHEGIDTTLHSEPHSWVDMHIDENGDPLHDTGVYDEQDRAAGGLELVQAAASGDRQDLHEAIRANSDNLEWSVFEGITALFVAARFGQADAVKILVKGGAEIDTKTATGSTPLWCATLHGHGDVVAILAANGANLAASTKDEEDQLLFDGGTVAHIAAHLGRGSVIGALVQAGKTQILTQPMAGGFTTGMVAAQNGHVEILQTLHEANVDIIGPCVTLDGTICMSALDFARQAMEDAAIQLLEQWEEKYVAQETSMAKDVLAEMKADRKSKESQQLLADTSEKVKRAARKEVERAHKDDRDVGNAVESLLSRLEKVAQDKFTTKGLGWGYVSDVSLGRVPTLSSASVTGSSSGNIHLGKPRVKLDQWRWRPKNSVSPAAAASTHATEGGGPTSGKAAAATHTGVWCCAQHSGYH